MKGKNLAALLVSIPEAIIPARTAPAVQVTGIALDSRLVKPGDIFVALVGRAADGHRFLAHAVRNGAVALVGSQELTDQGVPYLRVPDTRKALAPLSAAFYGFPARRLTVTGITGTDGKTTTASLLYTIMKEAGISTGLITTVSAVIGGEELDTGFHVTTPEAPDVQRYLAGMVANGLTHVILESTSHGLAQERVTACEYDIAVVTNITHEHLDYHGDYDGYLHAKGRLFEFLSETVEKPFGNPRLAVLNKDDRSYPYLEAITRAVSQVAYSAVGRADIWAEDVIETPQGISFTAVGKEFSLPIHSELRGAYNVSNILAAVAAAVYGLGIDPAVAASGIAQLPGVPGRMERIDLGQDFTAIVDFAHTPNALKAALQACRKLTAGRIIAVFGSAGLRDREKRRLMAECSVGLADLTILTAEDPRTESLDDILAEMADAAALRGGVEGETFLRIADRGAAIRRAVALARPGDLVVACGKGHEQSMCFGTVEYPWDDRIAMRAALAEHLDISTGDEMPYLPTRAD
jgi:UDP-N-acetylmuramoyl-L-alanyl-D-glutamate--2,6-diaminopimelate ligase